MKKTLLESLVDYDITLLNALASVRGAALTSRHQFDAVKELAAQLAMPTSVAIAVADLGADESRALAALQAAGGWMESHRFARQFGSVRPMGPGRLMRDRPWLSPSNPAEGLWYRGLVFQGFRPADSGVVEVIYIPEDLLALLPLPAPESSPALASADVPAYIQSAANALMEDVFSTLIYVRNHTVRLDAAGDISPRNLQAINSLCLHPVPADDLTAAPGANRLVFILHLCQVARLIVEHERRLTVNPDPARAWLQSPPRRRLFILQTAWREDRDWNDLQHVPSLKLQPTGWKNDPLLARQAIVRFLAVLQPLTWYRLDDLVAIIKARNPDFQRPDGDYSTWYILDRQDQPLMGFEHWDEVEGALIRYLATRPLHWLGVVDLGHTGGQAVPMVFRLTESSAYVLGQAELPAEETGASAQPTRREGFTIGDNFAVRAAQDANLYDRFQLARFADFVGREEGDAVYCITPGRVALAMRQGVTFEQIKAFLLRTTNGQVPDYVLDALKRWQTGGAVARLERALVLHVDTPETLSALRDDPSIGPLLGEATGPQSALIPADHERQVRRWLTEHGYL
jgi:hypothetical protein